MRKTINTKKTICFLLLICMIFSNISNVFAVGIGQSVDIVSLRECEQHINFRASNGNVGPVTASFVGYYENGQFYPAYCLEANKTGASSNLSYAVSVDAVANNDAVYRVLLKGYPYTSWQDMGLESEDDAFVATKQAIYCVLDNRDVNRYTARDARGQKIVDKIKELANFGKTGSITPYQSIINVNAISDAGIDSIDNKYISQTFVATSEISAKDIQIQLNTRQTPEGTKLVDVNNNEKNNFAEGEHFKIIVPRNKIMSDLKIDFILRANVKSFPVFYSEAPNETLQDYALVADPFTLATTQKTMTYSPNGKIEVVKISNKDSELTGKKKGEALAGAKFLLEGIDLDIRKEAVTDSNGKIIFDKLPIGKFRITEVESPNYYLKTKDTIYEVEIKYDDDNKKVTFENTPVEIKVNVDKTSDKNEAQGKENVTYEIDKIKNLSNVKLNNFTLTDDLPREVQIQLLETGTYNENLKYSVTYNTNKKSNIKLQDNLSTTINNTLDFSKVKLDKDEYITSYSLNFGTVKIGFSNITKMKVKTKVNEGLVDKSKFINNVKVSGTYLESKTEDKDDVPVTVYENILKISKTSKEYNQYTNLPAGTKINATFELLDESKKYITTINVNKNEECIYKYLETGKTYFLKEISTDPYYVINKDLVEFRFDKNGQVLELNIENDNVNLVVDVEKEGPTQAKQGEIITYNFSNVGNFSNVPLEDFIWGDKLPRQVRVQKIITGTWNEELTYKIEYITNKNSNWKQIGEEYLSTENNEVDFTNLELNEGEYVTEYRFLFGKVKAGFQETEKPQTIVKVNENLANNKIFVNNTYVNGTYEKTKVEDKDEAHTIVYTPTEKEIPEDKALPKTGFDY